MLGADNLQYFLEVARATRLNEAARVLQVDQSTVGRRISALERNMGQRLFDRSPTGWRLTEAGKHLLPHAEAVETTVIAAYDTRDQGPGTLSGSIRLVATDGFGAFIIAPNLVRIQRDHPNLDIELVTSTAHNAVSERHFDVAVTLERPSSKAARVEPLATYQLRLYATQEYLDSAAPITTVADLKDHRLIWYVNALLDVEPLRILAGLPHQQKVSAQISNITGHWLAARSGLGIAPLPSYIGNSDDSLIPVLAEEFDVQRTYWLVVPREIERLQRVRATLDFLADVAATHPDLTPRMGVSGRR